MTDNQKAVVATCMPENDFRKWRKAMGWTIEKAAAALEKHYRTIQRYERGEELPPASIVLACSFLAVQREEPDRVRRALWRFRRRFGLRGFIG